MITDRLEYFGGTVQIVLAVSLQSQLLLTDVFVATRTVGIFDKIAQYRDEAGTYLVT
jgi:hypothetical protein